MAKALPLLLIPTRGIQEILRCLRAKPGRKTQILRRISEMVSTAGRPWFPSDSKASRRLSNSAFSSSVSGNAPWSAAILSQSSSTSLIRSSIGRLRIFTFIVSLLSNSPQNHWRNYIPNRVLKKCLFTLAIKKGELHGLRRKVLNTGLARLFLPDHKTSPSRLFKKGRILSRKRAVETAKGTK